MFFWTLPAFVSALETARPEAAKGMGEIALRLRSGDESGAEDAFASLEGTSIDYALMEKAENVEVVAAEFAWDDLGSWDALTRSLKTDTQGNAVHGSARLADTWDSVVYNTTGQRINLVGVRDSVVVATDNEILVCPKDRAQDVRGLAND
jgi:mannose-1-phosphate guanylyltransferase